MKLKMIQIKIVILGLLIFSLTSCSNNEKDADASGIFEVTEILVSSEVNGKIMQFEIETGQKIDSTEILGYIDTTQLYLKKLQLLANIESMKHQKPDISKQLATVKQQIATMQNEQNRFQNLVKSNAATQKQLDDINSQIQILEKQLIAQDEVLKNSSNSVSNQIEALNIQIAQIDDMINKSIIKSPISGVVLTKYSEKGELAIQGKAMFKVADINDMTLRAYITANQLTKMKLGQEVKVFSDFDENKKREYTGKIVWISEKAEFTPKTVQTRDERANLVYAVKIAVKNDGYLKKGMYGELKLN